MLDYLQRSVGAVKFGYALFGLTSSVLFIGILGSVLTFSPLISVLLIISSSCLALFSLAYGLISLKTYCQVLAYFKHKNISADEEMFKSSLSDIIRTSLFMVSAVLTLFFALFPLPVLAVCIGMTPAVVLILCLVVHKTIFDGIGINQYESSMMAAVMKNFIKITLVTSAIYAIPTAMFIESALMGSHGWGLALFVVSCIFMGGALIFALYEWCQGAEQQAPFSENLPEVDHKEMTSENTSQLDPKLVKLNNKEYDDQDSEPEPQSSNSQITVN